MYKVQRSSGGSRREACLKYLKNDGPKSPGDTGEHCYRVGEAACKANGQASYQSRFGARSVEAF